MSVSNYEHFITILGQAAAQQGHYISEIGAGTGKFEVLQGLTAKTSKTLDTDKIGQLVWDSFRYYQRDSTLSLQRRYDLMEHLRSEVKIYESRIYDSKPWYQKLGACFGCISDGEKTLRYARQLAKEEKKTAKKALAKFNEIDQAHQQKIQSESINQFKQAFTKLSRGSVRAGAYEGFAQSGAIKSYIDDLEEYRKKALPGSTLSKVDHILKILKETCALASLSEVATFSQDVQEELRNRILEKMALLEKGNVGDEILLPGGYYTENGEGKVTGSSFVLYRLVKTDQSHYSLTIINTGRDLFAPLDVNDVVLSPTNELLERNDKKYTNIHEYKLIDLASVIAEPVVHEDGKIPLQVIEKRLDSTLFVRFPEYEAKELLVDAEISRTRNVHAGQSTAFKSISSFIHEGLGDDYQPFKVFVTERELQRITTLKQNTQDTTLLENLDKLDTIGKKALADRQAKVV